MRKVLAAVFAAAALLAGAAPAAAPAAMHYHGHPQARVVAGASMHFYG